MRTIMKNGRLEMISIISLEDKLADMVKEFESKEDWFELVSTYISNCGDTSKEKLVKDLSELLLIDADIVEPYVTFSISKNKLRGFVTYDGYMICPGDGELYLSERSKIDAIKTVGATRYIMPMSKSYHIEKLILLQTGKSKEDKLPIYDIERDIAQRTLYQLIYDGYLTEQNPPNYTQKLRDFCDAEY